jgi:hypothetical protein
MITSKIIPKRRNETTRQWLARQRKEERNELIWFAIGLIAISIGFGIVLYKCLTMPFYIWA